MLLPSQLEMVSGVLYINNISLKVSFLPSRRRLQLTKYEYASHTKAFPNTNVFNHLVMSVNVNRAHAALFNKNFTYYKMLDVIEIFILHFCHL